MVVSAQRIINFDTNQITMSTYKHQVEENFIRYAKIDTTADPNSTTFPSTMKQKDLAKLLVKELIDLGLKDAEMDEWGYVFATIPANRRRDFRH